MKKKYYIIILVMVLILSLIGVSYAYFQISDNSEANTHVYGQTPGGKIILTDVTNNLHLNIKASDMTLSNENKVYYADDTNDYVTNINDATHTIASITLSETEDTYDCVGDITVTLNIDENSMGKVLETDDIILKLDATKNNYTIDLSELKEIGTQKYNLVFSIDKNTTENIKAYVQLKNKETSQIYLAGKELNINIKVDNIVCDIPKSGTEVAQEVLGAIPMGFNTDKLLGGLYRYVGACDAADGQCTGVVDNFICFGTDAPESDCAGEVDSEYMYRIIGIDPTTGDLKLIKNKSILKDSVNSFSWHTTTCERGSCAWPDVDIYKRLNGLSDGESQGTSGDTNLFIDTDTANAKYLTTGSKWYDMIKDTDWLYGDIGESSSSLEANKTADEVYAIETGNQSTVSGTKGKIITWRETVTAKIGLMYIHDYYYSYASEGKDSSSTNCYLSSAGCKDSWLHLSKSISVKENIGEWTMSEFGELMILGAIRLPASNCIYGDGSTSAALMGINEAIRPVFFLDKSKVKISGNGTVTDPFVVSEVPTE